MKLSGIYIWLLNTTKLPGGKSFKLSNRGNRASLWKELPAVKKSDFWESLQISHNFKGNFNQNNINKNNFNQKLMFFDFINILTLLMEYRKTDLSGSEGEEFLWWTTSICTLKKNQIPPFDGVITPLFIVLNIPKMTLKMKEKPKSRNFIIFLQEISQRTF